MEFKESGLLIQGGYGLQGSAIEDRNLLKLRSLDPSCPFFLSDNSIWGQWTKMLQMLWSQG